MSDTILRADTIFHPVGQGGFTTGCLTLSQEPRHLRWFEFPAGHDQFFWAYDCGSVSHQNRLGAEIEVLAQRLNGRKLGLLVISHFDKDHISGLIKLLRVISVDVLLLPYAPLQERILSTLMAGADAEALEFAIDPAGYVAASAEGRVARIILVPQSTGEGEGGGTPFPIGPAPETPLPDGIILGDTKDLSRKETLDRAEYPERPTDGAPMVDILAVQASLSVWGLWEFLPYNRRKWLDKAKREKKAESFYAKVGALKNELLSGSSRKEALDELKELYIETFGKGSDPQNRISLALSSAPLHRSGIHLAEHCARFFQSGWGLHWLGDQRSWWYRGSNCADAVLTGDGNLKKEAFSEFAAHYGWRAEHPYAFQIPHHGSKANYHSKLAARVRPEYSVFCAEPAHGPTNHPDFIVYRSFQQYRPIIVDGEIGAHFCSRHVWR